MEVSFGRFVKRAAPRGCPSRDATSPAKHACLSDLSVDQSFQTFEQNGTRLSNLMEVKVLKLTSILSRPPICQIFGVFLSRLDQTPRRARTHETQ